MTERGYPVRDVAKRLGVSSFSLSKWLKGVNRTPRMVAQEDLRAENARLKAELRRVEEERDIPKKRPPRPLPRHPGEVRVRGGPSSRVSADDDVPGPEDASERVWATDITDIRTFEGWLYVAVVADLYSRIVVGWSMRPALTRELVLDALLMAVWRRRPTQPVIVHSDQGSQYGSDDVVRFCKDQGLIPSMSRRGNCFDNAVPEISLRGRRAEAGRCMGQGV